MNKGETKQSSPWIVFTEKMKTLFEGDKDISVEYDDTDIPKITVLVDSQDKYEALVKLLPTMKEFGNVKVLINVIPSNKTKTRRELVETLFKDNPVFSEVVTRKTIDGSTVDYAMFKPEIAQYYADNISDPYGNNNELYADIAREVFEDRGDVMYSTGIKQWSLN